MVSMQNADDNSCCGRCTTFSRQANDRDAAVYMTITSFEFHRAGFPDAINRLAYLANKIL